MNHSRKIYHSFIIRLWLEAPDVKMEADWSIELESIQSGQKHHFDAPKAMFDFLTEQIGFGPKPDGGRV